MMTSGYTKREVGINGHVNFSLVHLTALSALYRQVVVSFFQFGMLTNQQYVLINNLEQ